MWKIKALAITVYKLLTMLKSRPNSNAKIPGSWRRPVTRNTNVKYQSLQLIIQRSLAKLKFSKHWSNFEVKVKNVSSHGKVTRKTNVKCQSSGNRYWKVTKKIKILKHTLDSKVKVTDSTILQHTQGFYILKNSRSRTPCSKVITKDKVQQ